MALDITENNYLSWIIDAMNLGVAIKEGNQTSLEDRAKALILLWHHLHEDLKSEYFTVKDPLTLWNELKGRYNYKKTVILPKSWYDWMQLKLQDFKIVNEYNSALFKISSELKLRREKVTEEDMLEKRSPHFMPRMCSYNSSIESVDLKNTLN